MDGDQAQIPYRNLGKQLRELRDRAHETLAEASGAVEIDVKELASIELGRARPTEDVLLLLISHFGAKDDESVKLWELAGYNLRKIPSSSMSSAEFDNLTLAAGAEPRVLFTDVVDVIVNNYGVVMSFMQSTGTGKTPQSVARIGMSREHAKSVLQILQMTLNQTESNQTARKTPLQDSPAPESNQ